VNAAYRKLKQTRDERRQVSACIPQGHAGHRWRRSPEFNITAAQEDRDNADEQDEPEVDVVDDGLPSPPTSKCAASALHREDHNATIGKQSVLLSVLYVRRTVGNASHVTPQCLRLGRRRATVFGKSGRLHLLPRAHRISWGRAMRSRGPGGEDRFLRARGNRTVYMAGRISAGNGLQLHGQGRGLLWQRRERPNQVLPTQN
jgi:hypothetical protein